MKGGRDTLGLVVGRSFGPGPQFQPPSARTAYIAACTSLLSDILSGHAYSHAWIGLWNAAVRLGFFWLVAELLCRLRGQLMRERARADRDGLTVLLNAAAFCRVAQGQIDLLHRVGKTGALAFIDLDDFKQIQRRARSRRG